MNRRKARTRASLIGAAQDLLAEGRTDVAILAITDAADVGLGSFYNHFESREALFDAAFHDALDRHGAGLDALLRDLDDPAEVFAASFRITGRMHRLAPTLSRVILSRGLELLNADNGIATRARRDLAACADANRVAFDDLDVAMVIVGGATLALGRLLHDDPSRDDAATTDAVAESMLRSLGVSARDAKRLAKLPLPDFDAEAARGLFSNQ